MGVARSNGCGSFSNTWFTMAMAAVEGYSIRATIPSGFEVPAADECSSLLGVKPVTTRGCLEFKISSLDQLHKVDSLRSVDNLSVTVSKIKQFCMNKADVLDRLDLLATGISGGEWLDALRVWKYYSNSVIKVEESEPVTSPDPEGGKQVLNPTVSDRDEGKSSDQEPSPNIDTTQSVTLEQSCTPDPVPTTQDPTAPVPGIFASIADEFKGNTFRVTATRSGPKTTYTSMDAARHFATGIISSFRWPVNLKNSDIEVLLTLDNEDVMVGVALTRKSKYHRNLTYFGPTSLRATIAYGLLRFAHPEPGDVVIDPMCGGGSISIEGFHGFSSTFHIAGDNHGLGCKRTKDNLDAITQKMGVATDCRPYGVPMDVVHWDVTRLPLRNASVDVVVTDMPFGKKVGYKGDNWMLYKRALEECGRVCVPQTGRGVFMTHDTKAFAVAMKAFSSLWLRKVTYWVNLGGLKTGVYILTRTKVIL